MSASLALGLLAGTLYFLGLAATVARLSSSKRPLLLFRCSFALRMLGLLMVLGPLPHPGVAVLGVGIGRILVTRPWT